ncbi:MAG: AtpZ/AtpI family protein [Elusimicrobia bacterium]|nr:AtpZ/AtpI family protein [Elusimicrobiota bacterium]
MNDARQPPRRSAWTAFGAGTELVVFALAGFFAGRWADSRFGTQPWLLLAGTLLGICLGLYQFIRETVIAKDRAP